MMFVESYHYVVWNKQLILPIKWALCYASNSNYNGIVLMMSSTLAEGSIVISRKDRLQTLYETRDDINEHISILQEKLNDINIAIKNTIVFRAKYNNKGDDKYEKA